MTTLDPSQEKIRAELTVRGRVQGVCYRAAAQREGLRLGLVGEVRNLASGEVLAVAEGERRAVEEFVAFCRRGPPAARVDEVKVQLSAPRGGFGTFQIGH